MREFQSMRAYLAAVLRDESVRRCSMPIQEAAEALGLTKQRVHQLIKGGTFKHAVRIKAGRSLAFVFIDPDELAAYGLKRWRAESKSRQQATLPAFDGGKRTA